MSVCAVGKVTSQPAGGYTSAMSVWSVETLLEKKLSRKRTLDWPEIKSVILVVFSNEKKNTELVFIPVNISLLQMTPL